MTENRVVSLRQKGTIDDPLTEILRTGARRLIAQAVEAEFETFLASTAELELPDGRRRVVRHGHDPVRAIQTGIGPVEVTKPKARDRGATTADERIRYSSAILPKWARRTKSLDVLLPALYLRGVSTGDFQEVLAALLGKDAPNLPASRRETDHHQCPSDQPRRDARSQRLGRRQRFLLRARRGSRDRRSTHRGVGEDFESRSVSA